MFVTVTDVQLSVVIGLPKLAITASQFVFAFTVRSAGATIVGFVLSSTVTVCVAVAVFPALSVTVHVTIVDPSEKTLGALCVTEVTPQLSAVVGLPNTTLNAAQAEFAFNVKSAGAVIVGLVLSTTVTS